MGLMRSHFSLRERQDTQARGSVPSVTLCGDGPYGPRLLDFSTPGGAIVELGRVGEQPRGGEVLA